MIAEARGPPEEPAKLYARAAETFGRLNGPHRLDVTPENMKNVTGAD